MQIKAKAGELGLDIAFKGAIDHLDGAIHGYKVVKVTDLDVPRWWSRHRGLQRLRTFIKQIFEQGIIPNPVSIVQSYSCSDASRESFAQFMH